MPELVPNKPGNMGARWSFADPRRNRRTADFWGARRPRENPRPDTRAELGPYETRYDVSHGYNTTREILLP